MLRSLLVLSVLAACTPSPRKAAMPNPIAGTTVQAPGEADPQTRGSAMSVAQTAQGPVAQAAQGPVPEPVSVVGTPAPPSPVDLPAAALGRRTLSTAFVRVGPDGYLTIDLHDGRTLVLRDVVMGPGKYCGTQAGTADGARYCGTYAEVAAARPGGGPTLAPPDAVVGTPAKPMPLP